MGLGVPTSVLRDGSCRPLKDADPARVEVFGQVSPGQDRAGTGPGTVQTGKKGEDWIDIEMGQGYDRAYETE